MNTKPCTQCHRTLNTEIGGNDFVVLRPCKCVICPQCSFQLVVNRKFNTPICGVHNKELEVVYFVNSSRSNASDVNIIQVEKHTPNPNKDPCRHYESLFGKDMKECDPRNKMVLSLSYCHSVAGAKEQPASITAMLDCQYGPENDEDELSLRKIFGFLHEPIMKSHRELWRRTELRRMTPCEFCSYMMHEDDSLLLKLIYALATGAMLVPLKKISSDGTSFSLFLACCVAKEMIQRVQLDGPGAFQLMMGDALQLSDVPKELRDFLSKIRVSSHRTTVNRTCSSLAMASAHTKLVLDPLDGFSIHFDNIGFKGRKKKWSQHTVIQLCSIPYNKLFDAGFYQNGRLSRQRKTFDQLCNEIHDGSAEHDESMLAELVAKEVVGIKNKDWQQLTVRVLTAIETAIMLSLPSKEACQELAAMGDSFGDAMYPMNLGNKINVTKHQKDCNLKSMSVPLNGNIPGAALDDFDETDIAEWRQSSSHATFYDVNDMTMDTVLHEDPNAKRTVARIADYIENAARYDDFDSHRSGGELPVRDMFVAATCDGAPMKRWLDIKAEDMESIDEQKYNKATMFLGGFHFAMEFINMRGRLSRDIFGFFGKCWRPTLPQLNWILSVSDPTDYLREMPQYILAHYRCAYEMLKNTRGELDNVSAVDVHRHMLDRAVEYPICMAALLDLRLVEISFMIRDAEKSGEHGDVELFVTTMRFALALFTVTHATNYAHIVCDFLEWYELASVADKAFFTRWLYTKASPFGKPIWVDRGVEWSIRHIRTFLGKKAMTNQDQRMEHVVHDIPFRVKARTDLRGLLGSNYFDSWTTADWNSQEGRLSGAYYHTVQTIYNTNLWGDGELEGEFRCDDASSFRKVGDSEEEMPVSRSYLSAFDLGQQRATAYYANHHVLNRGAVTRSENEVSLKLLPIDSMTREKDLGKLKALRVSTEPKELEPLTKEFPIKKMLQELGELRECLYPEIPEDLARMKRSELVKLLCKHRKQYFLDHPQVYEDTLASVYELDKADTITSPDSRREQIKSMIYSLDDDAVALFQSKV